MRNLISNVFADLFGNEEDFYNKFMEMLEKYNGNTWCEEEKDNDVKSCGYYDKKIYKDNKLYDHIEKKFENGKCCSSLHEPNHGICSNAHHECENKCLDNKCCSELDKCDDKYLELKKQIKQKDEMIRDLVKENNVLKNKLNKIKNIF